MTRGAPVILNPASEYGKELSPQQVQQLLDGPARSDPASFVGEAEYPHGAGRSPDRRCSPPARCAAAWMIQVTFADRGSEPHPLVGIETDRRHGRR